MFITYSYVIFFWRGSPYRISTQVICKFQIATGDMLNWYVEVR